MQKNILLVTGSSNGLGSGLVRSLVKSHHIPVITYKTDAQAAQKTADGINNTEGVLIQQLDVASENSVAELAFSIFSKYNRLDTLICNAGIDFHHASFDEIELSEWQSVYDTKVFGVFNSVKQFLPLLRKSDNPNIIIISASLADKPDPLDPVYSSACAAVNNFARSLVYSLKDDGVRTNIICPGPMDTNLGYWKEVKKTNPEIFSSLEDTNPLKLTTQPSDIAEIVTTIVENRVLNGNTFYATGGSHLR